MMNVDILIQNGHVMDPSRNFEGEQDIGIFNGKIVDVSDKDNIKATKVINAAGCLIFPGLIDFHVHVFPKGSGVSVNPDYLLSTGVTSCVDAGTAGPVNFEAFYQTTIVPSQIRIKSYLNAWCAGQLDYGVQECFDLAHISERKLKRTIEKHRDNILGIKLRMSKGVALDPKTLDYGLKIAHSEGMHVNVHVSNPMMPLEEIVNVLGKDDIFCHIYQQIGNDSIFDQEGNIKSAYWKARERGVVFDAANGKMNFNLKTCQKAVSQGFWPDVISSDWLEDKYNFSPYAKNLTFILQKYIEMGMPFMKALACVTSTPARLMKMEKKIGTLQPGAYGDVSIFKIVPKEAVHLDSAGTKFKTTSLFVPQMTICDGEIAFCQADFAIDNWA